MSTPQPVPMTLLQVQYIENGDNVYKVLVPTEIGQKQQLDSFEEPKTVDPIICQVQPTSTFKSLHTVDINEKPSLTSFTDLSSKFKSVKSLVKFPVQIKPQTPVASSLPEKATQPSKTVPLMDRNTNEEKSKTPINIDLTFDEESGVKSGSPAELFNYKKIEVMQKKCDLLQKKLEEIETKHKTSKLTETIVAKSLKTNHSLYPAKQPARVKTTSVPSPRFQAVWGNKQVNSETSPQPVGQATQITLHKIEPTDEDLDVQIVEMETTPATSKTTEDKDERLLESQLCQEVLTSSPPLAENKQAALHSGSAVNNKPRTVQQVNNQTMPNASQVHKAPNTTVIMQPGTDLNKRKVTHSAVPAKNPGTPLIIFPPSSGTYATVFKENSNVIRLVNNSITVSGIKSRVQNQSPRVATNQQLFIQTSANQQTSHLKVQSTGALPSVLQSQQKLNVVAGVNQTSLLNTRASPLSPDIKKLVRISPEVPVVTFQVASSVNPTKLLNTLASQPSPPLKPLNVAGQATEKLSPPINSEPPGLTAPSPVTALATNTAGNLEFFFVPDVVTNSSTCKSQQVLTTNGNVAYSLPNPQAVPKTTYYLIREEVQNATAVQQQLTQPHIPVCPVPQQQKQIYSNKRNLIPKLDHSNISKDTMETASTTQVAPQVTLNVKQNANTPQPLASLVAKPGHEFVFLSDEDKKNSKASENANEPPLCVLNSFWSLSSTENDHAYHHVSESSAGNSTAVNKELNPNVKTVGATPAVIRENEFMDGHNKGKNQSKTDILAIAVKDIQPGSGSPLKSIKEGTRSQNGNPCNEKNSRNNDVVQMITKNVEDFFKKNKNPQDEIPIEKNSFKSDAMGQVASNRTEKAAPFPSRKTLPTVSINTESTSSNKDRLKTYNRDSLAGSQRNVDSSAAKPKETVDNTALQSKQPLTQPTPMKLHQRHLNFQKLEPISQPYVNEHMMDANLQLKQAFTVKDAPSPQMIAKMSRKIKEATKQKSKEEKTDKGNLEPKEALPSMPVLIPENHSAETINRKSDKPHLRISKKISEEKCVSRAANPVEAKEWVKSFWESVGISGKNNVQKGNEAGYTPGQKTAQSSPLSLFPNWGSSNQSNIPPSTEVTRTGCLSGSTQNTDSKILQNEHRPPIINKKQTAKPLSSSEQKTEVLSRLQREIQTLTPLGKNTSTHLTRDQLARINASRATSKLAAGKQSRDSSQADPLVKPEQPQIHTSKVEEPKTRVQSKMPNLDPEVFQKEVPNDRSIFHSSKAIDFSNSKDSGSSVATVLKNSKAQTITTEAGKCMLKTAADSKETSDFKPSSDDVKKNIPSKSMEFHGSHKSIEKDGTNKRTNPLPNRVYKTVTLSDSSSTSETSETETDSEEEDQVVYSQKPKKVSFQTDHVTNKKAVHGKELKRNTEELGYQLPATAVANITDQASKKKVINGKELTSITTSSKACATSVKLKEDMVPKTPVANMNIFPGSAQYVKEISSGSSIHSGANSVHISVPRKAWPSSDAKTDPKNSKVSSKESTSKTKMVTSNLDKRSTVEKKDDNSPKQLKKLKATTKYDNPKNFASVINKETTPTDTKTTGACNSIQSGIGRTTGMIKTAGRNPNLKTAGSKTKQKQSMLTTSSESDNTSSSTESDSSTEEEFTLSDRSSTNSYESDDSDTHVTRLKKLKMLPVRNAKEVSLNSKREAAVTDSSLSSDHDVMRSTLQSVSPTQETKVMVKPKTIKRPGYEGIDPYLSLIIKPCSIRLQILSPTFIQNHLTPKAQREEQKSQVQRKMPVLESEVTRKEFSSDRSILHSVMKTFLKKEQKKSAKKHKKKLKNKLDKMLSAYLELVEQSYHSESEDEPRHKKSRKDGHSANTKKHATSTRRMLTSSDSSSSEEDSSEPVSNSSGRLKQEVSSQNTLKEKYAERQKRFEEVRKKTVMDQSDYSSKEKFRNKKSIKDVKSTKSIKYVESSSCSSEEGDGEPVEQSSRSIEQERSYQEKCSEKTKKKPAYPGVVDKSKHSKSEEKSRHRKFMKEVHSTKLKKNVSSSRKKISSSDSSSSEEDCGDSSNKSSRSLEPKLLYHSSLKENRGEFRKCHEEERRKNPAFREDNEENSKHKKPRKDVHSTKPNKHKKASKRKRVLSCTDTSSDEDFSEPVNKRSRDLKQEQYQSSLKEKYDELRKRFEETNKLLDMYKKQSY